jgi:glycosyltransferase involved in cell wall biosynthesis
MTTLRIANFMDSSLEGLERKGNLRHALALYNPRGIAESVVHFTAYPADVRLAPAFAARGIEIFPFFDGRPRSTMLGLLGVPRALARVVRKMRRERLNLVRGRLPYFGSLIGCLAGWLLGVPSVVSLGGDHRLPQEREGRYYFGARWISFAVESAVLRLATAIVVPNAFTREYVSRIGGHALARKAVIVPWVLERALDPPSAEPSAGEQLGLAKGTPLVLIVGHLNRYKYSEEMFEVARRALASAPDAAQFVFCGDGPLREAGEQRLREYPGARVLGWQPNDVVVALMRRAAVVLVPMSGFVLLEAASLGAPVIASDVEWHAEMIRHDETGWLAPAGDVAAWAERVSWLLAHPVQARAAGDRLRALFQEAYAPDVALRQEAELYERLTGASARLAGAPPEV